MRRDAAYLAVIFKSYPRCGQTSWPKQSNFGKQPEKLSPENPLPATERGTMLYAEELTNWDKKPGKLRGTLRAKVSI